MGHYYKISLNNLNQFLTIKDLYSFVFRGQSDASWDLSSSLERWINKFNLVIKDFSFYERWMLDDFKKKIHLYSPNFKLPENNFEWLSVMQHYGAPTRLLDFTSSFYIACYFALIDSNTQASIWAINRHALRNNIQKLFNLPYIHGIHLKDEVNRHLIDLANNHISVSIKTKSALIPLEPEIFTERLIRQQGLFLMPTNDKLSFMINLFSIFDISSSDDGESLSIEELNKIFSNEEEKYKIKNGSIDELDRLCAMDYEVSIIKFDISKPSHNEILKQLRSMNITSEILFPGIEGLAKSTIQPFMIRNIQ
jgi:hypothetical protein